MAKGESSVITRVSVWSSNYPMQVSDCSEPCNDSTSLLDDHTYKMIIITIRLQSEVTPALDTGWHQPAAGWGKAK